MRAVPKMVAGALALGAIACGSGGESTPGRAVTWAVSPEPRLLIGEGDGPREYLFDRVASVRLLPAGGVVVADGGSHAVRAFAADGAHLWEAGGLGEGPGEFRWLNHLAVLPPDTILAYDGNLFRTTLLLADGTLVGTRQMRPEEGGPELYIGRYSSGEAALAWIVQTDRDLSVAEPDRMRIGRFGLEGGLLELLGDADGMSRMGPGPVPFSPRLHAVLIGDSILVTHGMDASVSALGSPEEPARPLPVPPAADPATAWAELTAELGATDGLSVLDWAVAEGSELERVPAIADGLVDDRERLWVKHYEPRRDSHLVGGWTGARGGDWSVVDAGGTLVARVTMPEDFVLLDVVGARLAGIVRDELGVERIAVFDLEG